MPHSQSISAHNDILIHVLDLLEYEDFTPSTLEKACVKLNLPSLYYYTLFLNGLPDFAKYMHDHLDNEMIKQSSSLNLLTLPIRERIFAIIKLRLSLIQSHKTAYRKLYYFLTQPHHIPLGTSLVWKTVDIMWRLAGDQSTDFNYYTKRGLLTAVYTSSFLYWLNDSSINYSDSWQFLRRRINNVLAIGTFKQKLKHFLS